jgi:hypothetical protein
MRGSEPVFGRFAAAARAGRAPGSGTGGVVETPAPFSGIVEFCAAAAAGKASITTANAATTRRRRDHGTPRTLMPAAERSRPVVSGAPCASVAAVLSPAQVALLQACTRVLVAPARVVMTGNVSPDAEAAIRGQATAGVEVLVVDPGAVARVDGSIDVLFIGPAAPYSVAAELFGRWAGRVAPGGLLFVHGAFAAAPLTAALLRTIGSSRGWRYYGREGELAEYVRADLTHGERMLDAMAQVAQVGYFARRLARRRLARQPA